MLQHCAPYFESVRPPHASFSCSDICRPVLEVSHPTLTKAIDVLEYFYYGGMLYIGLKQFREACEFLLMVLIVFLDLILNIAIPKGHHGPSQCD